MAGIVKKFKLEFWNKGKPEFKNIEISFVSNYCIREFNKIATTVREIQLKYAILTDAITDIQGFIIEDKIDTPEFKETAEKRDAMIADMETYDEDTIIKRRFKLIERLINDNGIEDEDLLSFEFWDEKVEPGVQLEFLETIVLKDIDIKKK